MVSVMTDTLTALLLRRSETGEAALLWGRAAKPHFGLDFDRLLAAGVLVEQSPASEWPTCAGCECGFDARPIQRIGGRIIATCPIDAGADTVLTEDDLRDFRIDAERLITLIAEASGFPGPVEALAPGLWRIGRLASGRSVVLAVSVPVLEQPGIVFLLKAAAGGASVTVLAPDPGRATHLRFLEAGIDLVELRAALRPGSHGIDHLDRDALEPTARKRRLSIRLLSQAVLIDGTPQRIPSQPFRLLALLAQEVSGGKGPVRNRTIEGATGREARDLIRELRDTLSAGRQNAAEIRNWIKARRALAAFELVLEPEQIEIAR